ncbi:MAG: glycosyltransferase family 2 protein [Spongiibacteraceae bacterium]
MTVSSSSPLLARSVGVVIVNFYTADYLRRCLSALMEQTRPVDAIVIVNNGDLPGAMDFIEQDCPAAQVIHQPNIGFAAANNLAIGVLASHEWIALLNPDAFPEPDWLEQLLLAASTHPDIDVFSSLLLRADNKQIIDGDGDSYHVSGLAWRHNHDRPIQRAGKMREVFSACAAAALYRRDALLSVQGFDESYFCYFEDIDLGFRLRLHGYRCIHIPDARAHHVGSATSGGKRHSDFALYHGHRNLIWTYVKNMPGYLFWLFLPVHIALNIFSIVWFALRGKGKVILRAKYDALRKLPQVWRQRSQIQAERTISPHDLPKLFCYLPHR